MPLIALLTDFGLQDHYVGAMKGAILSVCPRATLVDVCHDIAPHDIEAGAFALGAVYRDFPEATVFVAVVDPGVGSERLAVAVAASGRLFVGPDNGLFTNVLLRNEAFEVRLLANPALARGPLSRVFHGRDLFGPAAARLACGFPFADCGPVVHEPVRLKLEAPAATADGWLGRVVHVDRFGNLVTNLTPAELPGADPRAVSIEAASRALPFVGIYAEVAEGELCALMGSTGRLEIAVRAGRADAVLGLGRGAPVRVRRRG